MRTASYGLMALVIGFAAPMQARADEPKVRVSFDAGVTAGAIDGSAAWGGSAGYRFADRFSFDVEVTRVDKPADRFSNRYVTLDGQGMTGMARLGNMMNTQFNQRNGPLTVSGRPPAVMAPNFNARTDGNTLLATMGVRYDLPSGDGRLTPYVSGGFGISRTRQTFSLEVGAPEPATPNRRAPEAPIIATTINQDSTHTGLLGSLGGGASLRIVKQLSIDIDARYYRLDRGRNLGRFGGGISYRF